MDLATWQFINTFADWFSAFGTISAVVVALYLARRDKSIRLEVFAGHRLLITPGQSESPPEYVCIGIVNVGHRETQITNIGWKVGFLKKKFAIQTVMRDGISSPLPIRLRDGDEARYYIPLQGDLRWLVDFAEKMLQPNPKMRLRFLRIQVFTSVGTSFDVKIEKGLRNKLLDYIAGKDLP